MPTPEEIAHRFAFHPATTAEKQNAHGSIRDLCGDLAQELLEAVPPGREQATALTKLEEVMFWANAGIARSNTEVPHDDPRH